MTRPTDDVIGPDDGADNHLLVAALAAAARGWHMFPVHTPTTDGRCSCRRPDCRDIGKHPRTRHGLTDATADPDQVRSWWRIWPDANLALRTGSLSGVFVIDVDPEGFAAFSALGAAHGIADWCPDTWTVRTGRSGAHLYFRHPGPGVRVKTTAGVLAPGVDVRGDGGYAILPPSRHGSGNRYAWVAGLAPDEVDLVTAPDWLLALVMAASNTVGVTVPLAGEPIPEGHRHATLVSLAGSMRRRGFGAAAIAAALEVENAARCQPPLAPQDVDMIAMSVARYVPAPSSITRYRGLRVREVRHARA